MVKMSGTYLGEKHCEISHEPSQSRIETDAPKDNHGRGENFSPTDLLGAALGACATTVIAIWAEQRGLDLRHSKFNVTKEMTSNPRRVSRLNLTIQLPASLDEGTRRQIEEVAHGCPVKLSLSSDVQIPMHFEYVL